MKKKTFISSRFIASSLSIATAVSLPIYYAIKGK
jgi:virulence family protein